ncbi:MAG: division/cell wall cluster transcriptional repressor MraZ [Pseudomonadales bacterium]|jgi:MraZ protein|nr:division/cell wall cluster transcriptional repressor MraZ [Pseudomonadales bacterium]MBL6808617.1 division/cell wall cluster transcriptional repressor MraZ [Pseudomonadales bacterium]
MDTKGRMALPVRFRELLRERWDGALVATIDTAERCLLLYPQPLWEEIQAQLEALPNVDPATRRFQRLLIGHATDLELDGSGRVVVPPMLREYAGLAGKIVLLGQGRKIEIWAEEQWAARRDAWLAQDDGPATESTVALQSISL